MGLKVFKGRSAIRCMKDKIHHGVRDERGGG